MICSGTSDPHLKAISGTIEETLKQEDVRPLAVDGYPVSQWIVVDYGAVIVHIFLQAKRDFYSLEELWSDAPQLTLAEV